ncbi:hypothetical protein CKY28_08175 [Sphingomonas lenta]|uniref:Uncharacterized protein n=1 Tax=Sphingomonas lenta TaxID=1141887 RepID=A0A2A2SEE8_9SPHN|nr:hypothetical protein CKY28_08175 [Sphingomonas lenta]
MHAEMHDIRCIYRPRSGRTAFAGSAGFETPGSRTTSLSRLPTSGLFFPSVGYLLDGWILQTCAP